MNQKGIIPEALIRQPQVFQMFPIGKTTWWKGIKEGRYPKPIRLGARAVGWRVQDILDLIERQAAEGGK